MIKYNSKVVPEGYVGITLWPFIFISGPKDEIIRFRGETYHDRLINHEKIHLRQQLELLVIVFYVFYILNWVINLFSKGSAYKNICFEREANQNESNLDYLKTRKLYSFFKYLFN